MRSIAVSIVAFNTPHHLYVTLDALFRVRGIMDCPVVISFDGIENDTIELMQREVLSNFPIHQADFHKERVGLLRNITNAIQMGFQTGCQEVFYIESDHIVRADTLEFVRSVEDYPFLLSLSGSQATKMVDYRAKGNVIRRADYEELQRWIDGKRYMGKVHERTGKLFDESYNGHDGIFMLYVQEGSKETLFPDEFYVADFGLFGLNYPVSSANPDVLELYNKMYEGDRTRWLRNITQILKDGIYPPEPEDLYLRLWPRGYDYERGFNKGDSDRG